MEFYNPTKLSFPALSTTAKKYSVQYSNKIKTNSMQNLKNTIKNYLDCIDELQNESMELKLLQKDLDDLQQKQKPQFGEHIQKNINSYLDPYKLKLKRLKNEIEKKTKNIKELKKEHVKLDSELRKAAE